MQRLDQAAVSLLLAGGHRQLCEEQRVGHHRTPGDQEHALQVVLPRTAPLPHLPHQDMSLPITSRPRSRDVKVSRLDSSRDQKVLGHGLKYRCLGRSRGQKSGLGSDPKATISVLTDLQPDILISDPGRGLSLSRYIGRGLCLSLDGLISFNVTANTSRSTSRSLFFSSFLPFIFLFPGVVRPQVEKNALRTSMLHNWMR